MPSTKTGAGHRQIQKGNAAFLNQIFPSGKTELNFRANLYLKFTCDF